MQILELKNENTNLHGEFEILQENVLSLGNVGMSDHHM